MTISNAELLKTISARRNKWCAALESGKYKQARGRLENTRGSHCVLGVAQKLFKLKWDNDGHLSDRSLALLGIDCDQYNELVRRNDRSRWSFTQLAELIRSFDVMKWKFKK